ncbi:unnamed protein product [Parnassius mnemosyne]|uniref:Mitochondrial 3-ketoacyl-coa thiolase n=1 Tax=Parnassius mnemosyne TaxID=213953 RepID=A0AAV1KMV1_9NEOP
MPQGAARIFIVGAKRTHFCSYGGPLRDFPASHIFAIAAKDAMRSANINPDVIDATVVGNVNYLSQCDGGKTPRYCGLYSGVPIERPALGVNKTCGTGLQAVITGSVEILTGAANICLVGGTELMSSLPLLVRNIRFGTSLGTAYKLEDHVKKQLVDTFCGHSIEKIAEQIAEKYKLSREAVDQYTLQSHIKWSSAQEAKLFDDEITPIFAKVDKKHVILSDENPRSNLLLENLSTLAPVLDDGAIVTPGNSSAPADGAAALILANEESVNKHKITPMARLTAWACVGVDPVEAGLGAVSAILKLLAVSNKKIQDVDLFEINETFASQAIAVIKELKIDPSKVNINGGALAVGNPAAATGARMAAHLSHQIRRNSARTAVAASSCGGGQGIAILLESL